MKEDNQGGHYKSEILIKQRHDQNPVDSDNNQPSSKDALNNTMSTKTSAAPNTTTKAKSTISTTDTVETVSIHINFHSLKRLISYIR